jgi:hypothetical protein
MGTKQVIWGFQHEQRIGVYGVRGTWLHKLFFSKMWKIESPLSYLLLFKYKIIPGQNMCLQTISVFPLIQPIIEFVASMAGMPGTETSAPDEVVFCKSPVLQVECNVSVTSSRSTSETLLCREPSGE